MPIRLIGRTSVGRRTGTEREDRKTDGLVQKLPCIQPASRMNDCSAPFNPHITPAGHSTDACRYYPPWLFVPYMSGPLASLRLIRDYTVPNNRRSLDTSSLNTKITVPSSLSTNQNSVVRQRSNDEQTMGGAPPPLEYSRPSPPVTVAGYVTHVKPKTAGMDPVAQEMETVTFDIENTPVDNDPRLWLAGKKMIILAIISFASLAPTTGAFIYQPAIKLVEHDLQANTSEIALTLSLFILVQGTAPLLWSSISEIKGRKFVYTISMIIFTIGSGIGGASKYISVLICMRIFQAAGSSAVLALGAGTLADIYAPHERGTMMGIYYAAPLLGPSLGPLVGGALATAFNWQATFYFLAIIGGVVLVSLSLFRDTFRRERSLTYAAAKRHALRRAEEKAAKKKVANGADVLEKGSVTGVDPTKINVTLLDLNPFKPIWNILKRKNNLTTLFPSAILFALQYSVCFTTARTFATPPYSYEPLQIGLVLLSFGVGNMLGSVLGGKWSDLTYHRLKEKNDGNGWPEMRLKSTRLVMLLLPPSILAYAWTVQKHTHIAGPIISLFVSGFSVLFVYSSTLAYIVDANAGRSTAAVASNSSFRGIAGMIASEIAAPLQDAIGDGGLYSMWAGLLLGVICMIWVVILKGKKWREDAENAETAGRASGVSTPPEPLPIAPAVS